MCKIFFVIYVVFTIIVLLIAVKLLIDMLNNKGGYDG